MRVLFVASEGLPFSKTGGLADVVEALPKALVQQGHEVAVLLPRYRGNKAAGVAIPSVTIPMGSTLRFPAIADGGKPHGVQYFFVDDAEYFDRENLYGTPAGDYSDNAQRYAELCRAAIELAKQLWMPDVFHCHDWQSALVPVLLRTAYANDPALRNIPVVFTIHNMGYHGLFPPAAMAQVGLPSELLRMDKMEFFGGLNYLKGALLYSDYLTTVSPKYAQEIQTPENGHALDAVVRARADRLVGILNGVDYSVWSPENDPLIAAPYSAKDLSGKQDCKRDLLACFHMPEENLGRPLLGMVSRFADQKGFDLVAEIVSQLFAENVALAVLGSGDARYEKMFVDLAARFPDRVGAKIGYDNALAHKIEAGADLFAMPSRYEPCGLNQIYSLRYGTVPVVRATGGLDDTIEAFDGKTASGTGFKFYQYTGAALLATLREALAVFGDKTAWQRLQRNGMARDFSWDKSAAEYAKLYAVARGERTSAIPNGRRDI
jgi:starch synthase